MSESYMMPSDDDMDKCGHGTVQIARKEDGVKR